MGEMVLVFAGAGLEWDAAAFFVSNGLLDQPAARARMQALEAALDAEPRMLGEAMLFRADGSRMASA